MKSEAPRKTIVHVNLHVIRHNGKHGTRNPPISVRRGATVTRHKRIKIDGPCEIIYSPDKPLKCGAKVWIETKAAVKAKRK